MDPWESNQRDWIKPLLALRHYQTDSFLAPDLWLNEHIEEIFQYFGLVIVTRKGSNPWQLIQDSPKSHILGRYKSQMEIVEEWYPNDISSTMIREAVQQNKCVAHLVHQDVLSYIVKNRLYLYNTT